LRAHDPKELAGYDAMMQAVTLTALACDTSYDYDVEGHGETTTMARSTPTSTSKTSGRTLYLEDGRSVPFAGEGYDEYGNCYELEVD
jgi:hypothetical protein